MNYNTKVVRNVILICGIIIIFVITGCNKEKHQDIPESVIQYVNLFFCQAQKHGLDINLEDFDLTIIFGNIDVEASCQIRKNTIILDSVHWNNSNELEREFVIFHELGHCILERGHYSDKFQNGECKSIMRCGILCDDCSTNFISKSWQEYYISELFTENDDLLKWYNVNENINNIDSNCYNIFQIDKTIQIEGEIDLNIQEINSKDNFQIKFYFPNWMSTQNFIEFKLNNIIITYSKSNTIFIRKRNVFGLTSFIDYYYQATLDAIDLMKSISLKSDNGFYFVFVNDKLITIFDDLKFDTINIESDFFYGVVQITAFNYKN